MRVKIELFGSSRDFSKHESLELNVRQEATIKDIRNEILNYLQKNFDGNQNFINIVKSSAFSSEENIISDNYKITNNEKIAIIPPIGGG